MKFFIPNIADEARAEEIYQSIVSFAKETLRWDIGDRKVFKIAFFDIEDKKDHVVEVGKRNDINGEVVIAILDSITYLVCTLNRGVKKGMPMLVGKKEVYAEEGFE